MNGVVGASSLSSASSTPTSTRWATPRAWSSDSPACNLGLAISRYQSQNSFQVKSLSVRVAWSNW